MKSACGFCGNQKRKITNEHVFGEWIGPLFGSNRPNKVMEHGFGQGTITTRLWRSYGLDIKVRIACDKCNNGWMSDLEKAVAPIISPMFFGESRALSLREQVTLSAWAVKTCMVQEWWTQQAERYFTQDERLALMTDAVPAQLGARIWAGRYVVPNEGIRGLSACLLKDGGLVVAHLSTFAIGQLALQVFVERRSADYDERSYIRPGPWDRALISVWPPSRFADIEGRDLVWPPQLGLTEERFYELFKRFTPFGA